MNHHTGIAARLHRKLGDPRRPDSFSAWRRTVRFAELLRRFPDLARMRVLDLGGMPEFWRSAPVRPRHVTTVNLDRVATPETWLHHVVADACRFDAREHGTGRYDLVVSNSLLEHVGGHHRRLELARTIRKAAPSHWVQTPNRYFPVEPHYVAPGFQFLPHAVASRLVCRWPLAHERVHTVSEALDQVLWIELVGTAEMRRLFPGSAIWHERLAGLSKSIVAIGSADREGGASDVART